MGNWCICMLCGAGAGNRPLCPACFADLPRFHGVCVRCGLPLTGAGLCGPCSIRPPVFQRLVAPFPYQYPVDAMIRDFKFHGRLQWLRLLAGELCQRVSSGGAVLPDALVPVPMHWRRRLERGYNQAFEIARELERELGLPLDDQMLRRCRATPAQTGLSAAERRRNLRGAFAAGPAGRWQSVALVDDVVTTGATVAEAAKALKKAGVRRIEVWAIARTAR